MDKNQLLPCPLCDKSFRKQSLRFHLQNHTKEKHLKCEFCNATFSRPSNLKDHIKNLHSEGKMKKEKPIEVEANLKIQGNKTFPCNSCEKVFKSK